MIINSQNKYEKETEVFRMNSQCLETEEKKPDNDS